MESLLNGNMNENLALCMFFLKTRLLNTNAGMVGSVCVFVKVQQQQVIPNNRIEPMGSDLGVDPDGCWHKELTTFCCADPERINLWLTMPLISTSTS